MALPHGRKRPIKMIEPLRIFQWNSRSLFRAQLEEFRAMYFPLTKKAPGEGVAIIAIKESLRIWKLKLTSINNFETIGITVELLDGTKVDIISAYCCNGNICYRDDINLLFSSTGNTAIIGGDFNTHHLNWKDGNPSNKCGRILSDILLVESNFIFTTPKELGPRPCSPTRGFHGWKKIQIRIFLFVVRFITMLII